jgi:hypothetical protein
MKPRDMVWAVVTIVAAVIGAAATIIASGHRDASEREKGPSAPRGTLNATEILDRAKPTQILDRAKPADIPSNVKIETFTLRPGEFKDLPLDGFFFWDNGPLRIIYLDRVETPFEGVAYGARIELKHWHYHAVGANVTRKTGVSSEEDRRFVLVEDSSPHYPGTAPILSETTTYKFAVCQLNVEHINSKSGEVTFRVFMLKAKIKEAE